MTDYVDVPPPKEGNEYGGSELEQRVRELAALSPLEYDQQREEVAKDLGVRVSTLDKEVAKARPQEEKGAKGRAIELYDPDPWTTAVDGAAVLDEACQVIERHMHMREEDVYACALWVAHEHVYDCFAHTPRLLITAPDSECGKTVLMTHMVGEMVRRPQPAEDLSPAPFFRLAEDLRPCFLIDEADTFIEKDADILGGINNGWEPHGCAIRCVGDDNEPRAFSTHTPVVMAGIDLGKKLPTTTISRSVVVSLDRATEDELADEDIYDKRKHRKGLLDIGRKVRRWTKDNAEELHQCEPTLPPKVRNRLADKWRPLFAVAEVAGGHWPELAKKALFAQVDMSEPSKALQLLMDIHEVLDGKARNIRTVDLIERLCFPDDSPWADYNFKAREPLERRINPRQLAALLKRYNVKRRDGVRAAEGKGKGYHRDDIAAAWSRYLPRHLRGDPLKKGGQGDTPLNSDSYDENIGDTPDDGVPYAIPREPSNGAGCPPVPPNLPPQGGVNGYDDVTHESLPGYLRGLGISLSEVKTFCGPDWEGIKNTPSTVAYMAKVAVEQRQT